METENFDSSFARFANMVPSHKRLDLVYVLIIPIRPVQKKRVDSVPFCGLDSVENLMLLYVGFRSASVMFLAEYEYCCMLLEILLMI